MSAAMRRCHSIDRVLHYHEIAEAGHRILNPFTDQKLDLLGELCRLQAGKRLLDLACGKGELLCRWAHGHPDHPDAPAMREFLERGRRVHLEYGRNHLGWGAFVLRPA